MTSKVPRTKPVAIADPSYGRWEPKLRFAMLATTRRDGQTAAGWAIEELTGWVSSFRPTSCSRPLPRAFPSRSTKTVRLPSIRCRAVLVERPFDLVDPKRLEQVTFLDVVKSFEPNAALHTFADFASIVLPALQRGDIVRIQNRLIAADIDAAGPLDRAAQHTAAGDRPQAADLESLQHDGPARHHLLALGPQQAFEAQFDRLSDFVDDLVPLDIDADPLGQHAGALFGNHVEGDDDRVRGLCERHVALVNAPHSFVHNRHSHFGMRELSDLASQRLDRALRIGLYDQREVLDGSVTGRGQDVFHRAGPIATPEDGGSTEVAPFLNHGAGLLDVVHHPEAVARARHAVQPGHLNRR